MERNEMTTAFKEFARFLKERHVFGEFMSECLRYGKNSLPNLLMHNDANKMKWQDLMLIIDFAFPWCESRRKHSFYSRLSKEWKEKLQGIQETINGTQQWYTSVMNS